MKATRPLRKTRAAQVPRGQQPEDKGEDPTEKCGEKSATERDKNGVQRINDSEIHSRGVPHRAAQVLEQLHGRARDIQVSGVQKKKACHGNSDQYQKGGVQRDG
jgi:hypothetical protein